MGARRAAAVAAWCVALGVVGACSDDDGEGGAPFTMLTTPPQGAMEGAMLEGVLAVEKGCLGLEHDDEGFLLVLWTDGSTLVGDQVVAPSEATFGIGDRLVLGGGASSSDDVLERGAPPGVERCVEATGCAQVWVGGWPMHVDGGLL